MAIPNINQITSTLRTMGDAQLKQYAEMNKNDPYILPMAIAESNARKQMRSQVQAKTAMQPQPKVAEKEIAQMTNCSINTALGRMRYGLINLRKMMTERGMSL